MDIKPNKGFSLIEILVAFSIATVALAIIFQIYVKGTTSAILGEEYAQAIAIAESRLAEFGVNAEQLNGTVHDKYAWTIETNDYIDEEASSFEAKLLLKQVTVNVSWETKGKQRNITLHSLKPFFES